MLLCHHISTRITSFRVVSQSSPPATIRIVVFLNFEYSFYSFFSVFVVFFCARVRVFFLVSVFFCFRVFPPIHTLSLWAQILLVGNYGPEFHSVGNYGPVVFFDHMWAILALWTTISGPLEPFPT